MDTKKIESDLSKIVLSDVVDYEITGNELLVTTKPVPPAMVNKLTRFQYSERGQAGNAADILHKMINAQ